MAGVSAADLAILAERCAAKLGMPITDDVPVMDPIERMVFDFSATDEPWRFRPGMKLGIVRRALLRVLRPFTERQERRVDMSVLAVTMMSDEVLRLRARVSELERLASLLNHSEESR